MTPEQIREAAAALVAQSDHDREHCQSCDATLDEWAAALASFIFHGAGDRGQVA